MGTVESAGRNTHKIVFGSHSGTHMDAPFHFLNDGKRVQDLDISKMIGSVTIVDFRSIGYGNVVSLVDVHKVEVTSRILFVFG